MPSPARLISLATAVPSFVLRQDEVMAQARLLFQARGEEIERLLPVYDNAGIETRYSCVPLDWFARPVAWSERNRLYVEHGVALLEAAATRCLEAAKTRPLIMRTPLNYGDTLFNSIMGHRRPN